MEQVILNSIDCYKIFYSDSKVESIFSVPKLTCINTSIRNISPSFFSRKFLQQLQKSEVLVRGSHGSSHLQTQIQMVPVLFSLKSVLFSYFLFIYYLSRCTISDFPSVSSLASLPFYLVVIEQQQHEIELTPHDCEPKPFITRPCQGNYNPNLFWIRHAI